MATIKSVKSGGWSDPETWDLQRIPVSGDTIIIGNDTRVTCEKDMAKIEGSDLLFEGHGSVLDMSQLKDKLAFKGYTGPADQK